ncbi:MAG: M48 family metalloprotease [Elusimicrobia bacterium]|nr:M48 family metalloprotease [Elusimicrobiota bacterium]
MTRFPAIFLSFCIFIQSFSPAFSQPRSIPYSVKTVQPSLPFSHPYFETYLPIPLLHETSLQSIPTLYKFLPFSALKSQKLPSITQIPPQESRTLAEHLFDGKPKSDASETSPESHSPVPASGLFHYEIQELFKIRHQVQLDARKILQDKLGGDVGDGLLHKDVQRVLKRLTEAAGLPSQAAQVFVGNSFIPQAFTTITETERHYLASNSHLAKTFRVANVFLSLGLLRALDNEAQLAFVLGHELQHNWKNHLKDFLGSWEALGHFHELEADREALKLAAAAGYDPREAMEAVEALYREYDRLENRYRLLKKDSGEILKLIQSIQDIHPHPTIRKASMMDHLGEAMEKFKHRPPLSSKPLWTVRRDSAIRPSHVDRLEKRIHEAIQTEKSADQNLYSMESIIAQESAKGRLKEEGYAILEEAYHQILSHTRENQDLRAVEVSLRRHQDGARFPTRGLKSGLITHQLDTLLKNLTPDPTLEEFLNASLGLGNWEKKAGTLRLLGQIRTRKQLDSAFKTLSHEAENLGFYGQTRPEDEPEEIILDVTHRIWKATQNILTSELGRPVLPEEIIQELKKGLWPSWLKGYVSGFNVQILETAFGPEATRSKQFTPSQLAARLESLPSPMFLKPRIRKENVTSKTFAGLFRWSQIHYTPGSMQTTNNRILFRYERYHIQGLKSPALKDQLDITWWFLRGDSLPPPFIQILKQEGNLEIFLKAALQEIAQELHRRIHEDGTSAIKSTAVQWYFDWVGILLDSALQNTRDFKTIRETLAFLLNQVEETLSSEGANLNLRESNLTYSWEHMMKSFSEALLRTVSHTNQAGVRPKNKELKEIASLIQRLEKLLSQPSGLELIQKHAHLLHAHIDRKKNYMTAYHNALPKSFSYPGKRLHERRRKKFARQISPDADKPIGLTESHFAHFLSWVGNADIKPEIKLMAAALMDKFPTGHPVLFLQSSSFAVGRWLLEDVVQSSGTAEEVQKLARDLLQIRELHPALFQPPIDNDRQGSLKNAFQGSAKMVLRSEPFISMLKGEHPFREVSSRWALQMLGRMDSTRTWPKNAQDRLRLMDLLNSTGEFDSTIDNRILEEARSNPKGFLSWLKKDKKWLKSMFNSYGESPTNINTPWGEIPVPLPTPLRVIRHPILRAQIFQLLPEANIKEKPRFSPLKKLRAMRNLYRQYRRARKYFTKEFLKQMQHEGSLEEKIFEVLEEVDRHSTEETLKAKERWDRGEFTSEDKDFLEFRLPRPRMWRTTLAHRQEEILTGYKNLIEYQALAALWNLYQAYAGTQEPLLQFLLENYPEPTRSRDEILERIMKKRRLSPGSLSFLESHKSYRMPNPLRRLEKTLLDTAVIQTKRLSPAERVDILLHTAGVQPLSPEREKELNHKFLKGDRKKLAREKAALRSVSELQKYITLLHPKDRSLIMRAQFYGETSLHQAPEEVWRLYRNLVIEKRNIPPFLKKILEIYFELLREEEKAHLISDLAARQEVGQDLTGPEILKVALKNQGVTGAKIAQVLNTHKGLLPPEYTQILEDFKDNAQEIEKMRSFEIIGKQLEPIDKTAPHPDGKSSPLDSLDSLSREILPNIGEAVRQRLLRQVRYLLWEQKARVRKIQNMGPELGSGSIKVVYKLELEDGRTWVAKFRVPGASYHLEREFQILEQLVQEVEKMEEVNVPDVESLLKELRELVQSEMDFRDEAGIQSSMIRRVSERSWAVRLVSGPKPFIPSPHPLYLSEDMMVEEYVPSIRFRDLPFRSLLGPSQQKIARRAVQEGMLALVLEEWLEPDPHTGNRHARKGWLHRILTRLVLMDLGQGKLLPIAQFKPWIRAGLALDSGDIQTAARTLASTMKIPGNRTSQEIVSSIQAGLQNSPQLGVVERLVEGLIQAEKKGAMVRWEHAPLQKAFVIYSGYSPWLPKNYIQKSLEKALALRLLQDGSVSYFKLLRLWLRKTIWGTQSIRTEMEKLVENLKSR